MSDQSPPKRVTRARAAAKTDTATGPAIKTTKVATSASKAKLARTVSTSKRRTRADDEHEDELEAEPQSEDIIEPEPKTTRGRPKKAVQAAEMQEEAPAPAKATRGRPKKITAETPVPAPEPARATRGRGKKIEVEEAPMEVDEPVKRPTRARGTTVTKPTAPKKTVKFEEPDKENIVPTIAKDTKPKAPETATGLRAKPVRKPAPATRATRGRPKNDAEEKQKSSPLSPKKATQVTIPKDCSDDELATSEKTPMRPLMKSPIKPSGAFLDSVRKPDFTTSLSVNNAMISVPQNMKNSILGSPARRPAPSPFKDVLKNSPQKLPSLQSPFKLSHPASKTPVAASTFKTSLLASPARRPQSPMKVTETGSPSRSTNNMPTFAVTPKASTFKISRFATPRTLINSVSRAGMMLPPALPSTLLSASPELVESSPDFNSAPAPSFSGRLSSIVPREAEEIVDANEAIVEEGKEIPSAEMIVHDEPVIASEQPENLIDAMEVESTTPPASPSSSGNENVEPQNFAFREVDENPFQDSDSEDELASDCSPIPLTGFKSKSARSFSPTTPAPFAPITKTPKTAFQDQSQNNQIGFTPLAKQLNEWMAASPIKPQAIQEDFTETPEHSIDIPAMSSPTKSTFFEDEMTVRDEIAAAPELPSMEPDIMENFSPVDLVEEDLALAQEADDLSLLEPEEIAAYVSEEHFQDETEDAPSEASEEYGDENAIPIDPELLALPALEVAELADVHKFVTPKRVLGERVFHTVCKVPLKPAAEDTPMRPSPKKRSASISRLPVQRPTSTLSRNNTVISYSPTKSTPRSQSKSVDVDTQMQDVSTPSKSSVADWSTMGTPARTPRRDLNTKLLKGAVAFVDVHTSEGADASVLFTELLTQMGARCVKSWTWNGNGGGSGNGEEGGKIGITHVVYKDGGKRTLERVREAAGVVACVGVGWVLDCERENKWLSESPYSVDTSLIPRGGHKRRKSMEPRALANLNGTLVPSTSTTPHHSSRKSYANTSMSPTKEFLSLPDTPMTNKSRRRESVQWVHLPEVVANYGDETLLLSPVPVTPAPETISRYGEDGLYGDETPGGQTPYFLKREEIVQKTAPQVGRKFVDTENEQESGRSGGMRGGEKGLGFLSREKDQSVMMRLMAARRKSLQWAPKVGSPLARGEGF